jgi:hypothetical protein
MPGRTLDGHDEWARRAAPGCRGLVRLLRYQRSFAALESTKFGLSNLSGSKFHETVSWHWICGDWKVPLSDVGDNAIGGIAAIEKPVTCIIRRVPPLGRNRSRGLNNAEGLGTASRMRLRFDPCISSVRGGCAVHTTMCVSVAQVFCCSHASPLGEAGSSAASWTAQQKRAWKSSWTDHRLGNRDQVTSRIFAGPHASRCCR